MSLKFKVADWRFEIDWQGMTAEPSDDPRENGEPSNQRSEKHGSARKAIDALQKKVKRSQEPTDQGEKEAWT